MHVLFWLIGLDFWHICRRIKGKANSFSETASPTAYRFMSWDHLCYFCLDLFMVCLRARMFTDALWSPAGKGLTSWLSFVMSNCEVVTFLLVSWVRCGA